MAYPAEQPFHDRETRYFLAEILKASEVPLADLVKVIQDKNIAPQWEQIALPNGRSLAACKMQFNRLTNRVSSFLAPPRPPDPLAERDVARRSRPPGQTQSFGGDTPLQPQQHYQFAPINEPAHPTVFQSAPYAPADTSDRSGKKRGRPSKAERELREAEARARGEVYQPTKRKPKVQRPSAEGTEGAEGAEPSSAKKPAKRTKVEGEATETPPGARTDLGPALEASPGDSMHLDTPERQYPNVLPQSDPARYPVPEPFLSGMRGQAAESEGTPAAPLPVTRLPQIEAIQSSPGIQYSPTAGNVTPGPPGDYRTRDAPPTSRAPGGVPGARMT